MGAPFLVSVFLYADVYDLSLPIRPFQGPLYTVRGPFYPRAPWSGGSRVICAGSASDLQTKPIELGRGRLQAAIVYTHHHHVL